MSTSPNASAVTMTPEANESPARWKPNIWVAVPHPT